MARSSLIEVHSRSRARKAERRSFAWQIIKGVFKLLILAAILALTWYVTRLPVFTITDITVSGGETVSHDSVTDAVQRELTGTYVLLIPKHFAYLYPHDRIVEAVLKDERVYDVSVTRASRTSLAVSFEEYVPHALWCLEDGIECFFMTDTGYAFTHAPALEGSTLIRHSREGVTELKRGQAMSTEELSALDAFIQRVGEKLQMRIATVFYRTNGDIECTINGGGAILLSGKKDIVSVFENLEAVLHSEEFAHITPGNFQYIDVRFDNKVFVNEEPVAPVATTTDEETELPE